MRKWMGYVAAGESEVVVMAGLADWAGKLEIGGELYGLYTRAGSPVILLVTGPGQQAICRPANFVQDLDFCQRTNRFIESTYGIQRIGSWHSHADIALHEPSDGDTAQVRSITGHNGLRRWCDIVVTVETGGESYRRTHEGALRRRINAFIYTNVEYGHRVRAPIRILAGMSPYRLALLADPRMPNRDIGEYGISYPMDRIVFDAFEPEADAPEQESLPKVLARQLTELPAGIREHVRFCREEDWLVFTLPLPKQRTVFIACEAVRPHAVASVMVRHGDGRGASDVTQTVLSEDSQPTLSGIYEMLLLGNSEGSCRSPAAGKVERTAGGSDPSLDSLA